MTLDIPTLAMVTVFVLALLGCLLIFASVQNSSMRAPLLWGVAYILIAAGMTMVAFRGRIPDWLSIEAANAQTILGMMLVWAGARVFDGRRVALLTLLSGPALWLAACAIPQIGSDINARIVVASMLTGTMALLAAREIWRGRSEPLMSRWPSVITLSGYGICILARIPLTLVMPQTPGNNDLLSSPLFPALSFASLMFAVVLAFLLLNMCKERLELQHKTASLRDPLCGVPNRRAFLDGAEQMIEMQRFEGRPLAVLLFDLDHFKAINDRFGHAAGDEVLRRFARQAARQLGPKALFGRIGGEEFAAIMPAQSMAEATDIADRVRGSFALAAETNLDDQFITPTVSIGVALGIDPDIDTVVNLLAAADGALYRAKAEGRDRVAPSTQVVGASAATLAPKQPGITERRFRAATR